MINFTFAALTLGFASAGTYVPRTRAILASIWHEALPMLVYSQVLIWGQSCVALLTVGLLRMGNPDVSIYLGAVITMGLETGRDVMSFSSADIAGEWSEEVTFSISHVKEIVKLQQPRPRAVCLPLWSNVTGGKLG